MQLRKSTDTIQLILKSLHSASGLLDFVQQYRYLGILWDEHLKFGIDVTIIVSIIIICFIHVFLQCWYMVVKLVAFIKLRKIQFKNMLILLVHQGDKRWISHMMKLIHPETLNFSEKVWYKRQSSLTYVWFCYMKTLFNVYNIYILLLWIYNLFMKVA